MEELQELFFRVPYFPIGVDQIRNELNLIVGDKKLELLSAAN